MKLRWIINIVALIYWLTKLNGSGVMGRWSICMKINTYLIYPSGVHLCAHCVNELKSLSSSSPSSIRSIIIIDLKLLNEFHWAWRIGLQIHYVAIGSSEYRQHFRAKHKLYRAFNGRRIAFKVRKKKNVCAFVVFFHSVALKLWRQWPQWMETKTCTNKTHNCNNE